MRTPLLFSNSWPIPARYFWSTYFRARAHQKCLKCLKCFGCLGASNEQQKWISFCGTDFIMKTRIYNHYVWRAYVRIIFMFTTIFLLWVWSEEGKIWLLNCVQIIWDQGLSVAPRTGHAEFDRIFAVSAECWHHNSSRKMHIKLVRHKLVGHSCGVVDVLHLYLRPKMKLCIYRSGYSRVSTQEPSEIFARSI